MFLSFPFTLQGNFSFSRVQFHTFVAFGIAPSFLLIARTCACSSNEGVHMGSIFKLQSEISFQGCKRRQKGTAIHAYRFSPTVSIYTHKTNVAGGPWIQFLAFPNEVPSPGRPLAHVMSIREHIREQSRQVGD